MNQLPRTLAVLEAGVREGLHLGAQIYVSLRGATVVDGGVGLVRRDLPMSPATINRWYSSGKPLAAVAIAKLWELGRLDLDDRVAQHIPEFAAGGKEAVTLRHILTHTGGFRGWGMRFERPWDEVIAAIAALPIERGWIPGEKAGYHGQSSWFILGEIIRRLDGRSYNDFVRGEIFHRLGVEDTWFGMPAAQYRTYGDRIGSMYEATDKSPPDPDQPMPADDDCATPSPGAGLQATARSLGRFYEMLLNKGMLGAARILQPQTVEALVARHRVGLHDHTFGKPIDWGLGFLLNSDYYGHQTPYGYGRHASQRTFGHGGQESSDAFADPERHLVVAWLCNGQPGDKRHQLRHLAINEAIYEDLGLATKP